MQLVITIDGTAYAVAARNTARLRIDDVHLELEGYGQVAFTETKFKPVRTWKDGKPVSLTIDGTPCFSGVITQHQAAQAPTGWKHSYTALSLRWQADAVPITATDGTGTTYFNRTPDDDYYLASDAGLTVGQIITRILTNATTATALFALGVGGYPSSGGLITIPATLPTATVNDLALLTVVPPSPVVLSGENLFNQLAQFVSHWHPKYALEITAAGIVRVKDTTSTAVFVPRTVTLGGPSGAADPVPWPTVRRNVQECATRLVLSGGPNVTATMLSLVDGTLAEGFTSTDKTNWNLTQFTQPQGAVDYGTVSSNTSTSATIMSHDATVHWASGFWTGNQAWITLSSQVNTGISVMEGRPVTVSPALTAGGSATIQWDASWPVSVSNYDHYRLVGAAGGLIDTWRVYTPREPQTGHTGLNTWVGAHLVARSAKPIRWSNNTTSRSEYYTTASVIGGLGGKMMVPWTVTPVPSLGEFRFTYPTVQAFGQTSALNQGSPTTTNAGLPADVQILALYSLGALSVTVPADISGVPQYQGKAFTESNVQWTHTLNYPDWIFAGDAASMTTLAQEHLDAIKDPVIEGSVQWYVSGSVPGWSWMTFDHSMNIAVNGGSSDWTAINAPIRSIGVRPMATPEGPTHVITFGFSTRRKPFSGDDLYTHPRYAGAINLGTQGGYMVGGIIPGMGAAMYQDSLIGTASGVLSGQSLDPGGTLGQQAGSMLGPTAPGSPMAGQPSDYGPGAVNEAFGSGVPTAMGPSDLGIPMSVADTGADMGGVMDAAAGTSMPGYQAAPARAPAAAFPIASPKKRPTLKPSTWKDWGDVSESNVSGGWGGANAVKAADRVPKFDAHTGFGGDEGDVE